MDLATSRAHWMNSGTTGESVRFLRVTIPTGDRWPVAIVCGSARPGDERDLRRPIEHARRARFEPAARQHVLRGAPGTDLGEHGTAAGDANMRRLRQMELVIADVEK